MLTLPRLDLNSLFTGMSSASQFLWPVNTGFGEKTE
jgi:hypothetical protein